MASCSSDSTGPDVVPNNRLVPPANTQVYVAPDNPLHLSPRNPRKRAFDQTSEMPTGAPSMSRQRKTKRHGSQTRDHAHPLLGQSDESASFQTLQHGLDVATFEYIKYPPLAPADSDNHDPRYGWTGADGYHHESPPRCPKRPLHDLHLSSFGGEPSTVNNNSFGNLPGLLTSARAQIASLQSDLRSQRMNQDNEVRKVKMDMMLDILKVNELAVAKEKVWQRERHRLHQKASSMEVEAAKHKAEAEDWKAKSVTAQSQANASSEEAEHLRTLNNVLEEDLDELRRIENEDRIQKPTGLPPAYGSLDDEDQQPAYYQHDDCGAFDVASLKRSIRERFNANLIKAQFEAEMARNENTYHRFEQTRSATILFVMLSFALSDACGTLKSAMSSAHDLQVTQMDEVVHAASAVQDRYHRVERRSIARLAYVADRAAKVLLELGWQVVAACELRSNKICLTKTEKAQNALTYQEVDQCLYHALREVNQKHGQDPSGLHTFQNYLTQVSSLQSGLMRVLPERNGGYEYFKRTLSWLTEQVEFGRMLNANADPSMEDDAASEDSFDQAPKSGDESDPVFSLVRRLSVSAGDAAHPSVSRRQRALTDVSSEPSSVSSDSEASDDG